MRLLAEATQFSTLNMNGWLQDRRFEEVAKELHKWDMMPDGVAVRLRPQLEARPFGGSAVLRPDVAQGELVPVGAVEGNFGGMQGPCQALGCSSACRFADIEQESSA